jgi:hypothetical protein
VAAIALVAQPIAAGGASRPELPAGAPPPSPRPGRRGARPGVALWLALLGLATLGFNKTRLAGWAVSDLIFLLGAVVTALKMLSGKTADLAPATMRKTSPPVLVGTIVLGCAGTLSCFQSFTPFDSAEMVVRIVDHAGVVLVPARRLPQPLDAEPDVQGLRADRHHQLHRGDPRLLRHRPPHRRQP